MLALLAAALWAAAALSLRCGSQDIPLGELLAAGRLAPALIVGVPVGFVNVVESKELIMAADVPYIVARGRKGGSNVAAAICNAMLYQIKR